MRHDRGCGRIKGERCRENLTIGSGDNNLEVLAPLTSIHCVILGHWTTPERTFDVGRARRVVAVVSTARLYLGVALEVDVEGLAADDGIALFGAAGDIVGRERSVAEVAIRVVRCLLVGEGLLIARWSFGFVGSAGKVT